MAHLWLPGTSGSGFEIPDPGPLFDETAIVDVRADTALVDYTSGEQMLLGRWGSSATQRAWKLTVDVFGRLRVQFASTQGTFETLNSTSDLISVGDGNRVQVRGLLNATAQTCDFYTRSPGLGLGLSSDTSWSALGTQLATAASVIYVPVGVAPIQVGAANSDYAALLATGKMFGVYFRKGGATEVADVDFSNTSTWVYS